MHPPSTFQTPALLYTQKTYVEFENREFGPLIYTFRVNARSPFEAPKLTNQEDNNAAGEYS